MQEFQVSALKYRPSAFDAVVGQESITKTLMNAIESDELAKAYLFCGPRGVGKTTCARIFAKEINKSVESQDENLSYNLFELDAASNNSVEDIRQIIDQVRVPPQIGEYKVYIIDEVHMLSKAAFNAFLKTLEEPPAHAIFILATTEKHKVLPTILSRCQIYDFKRITVMDMVRHLEKIAQNEGIPYEVDALQLIAQKADGALRDALSIFDQMVSFTGKNLTRSAVAENLNVLDFEIFFNACNMFLNNDISGSLLLLNQIIADGFDPQHYVQGLNEHFRNLLVVKDPQTVQLLDQTDNIKQQYLQQSANYDPARLLHHLEEGQKTNMNYRSSNYKRLLVEVMLMKFCQYGVESNIEKKNSASEVAPVKKEIKPSQPTVNEVKTPTPAPKPSTPPPPTGPLKIEKKVTPIAPSAKVSEPSETNSLAVTDATANTVAEAKSSVLKINRTVKRSTNAVSVTDRLLSLEKESIALANRKKESFTISDVIKHWKDYAEIVKKRKEVGFAQSLATNLPVLLEDNSTLEVAVENMVQMDNLKNEKPSILKHLRAKLQNDHIKLQVTLADDSEEATSFKTPTEQLKDMIKKKPELKELWTELHLRLED